MVVLVLEKVTNISVKGITVLILAEDNQLSSHDGHVHDLPVYFA
jgi:hypothetical protein